MSDIRKYAVTATSRLHLRDADDNLLYADGPDGKPDKSKPMVATIYGHGSKQHSKWSTLTSNRFIQRLKKKGGKADQSEKELADERVEMLMNYTESIENMGYGDLPPGPEALRATFEDPLLGFIGDQIAAHIGEWGNFLKPSTPTSGSTSVTAPG